MRICFVYSNRAEYSLLSPFIQYFKKNTLTKSIDLKTKIKNIESDGCLDQVYSYCYKEFSKNVFDFVIILGDRRELPFIALASFFADTKIVHIAAGEDVKGIPTYDQFFRPLVTILANNHICFSKKAQQNVSKLFSGLNNFKSNSKIIGNPVFYGIDINNLKRKISDKYDLVLLHPQSTSRKGTQQDIKRIEKLLKNKTTIFINGNKDKNHDLILKFYKKLNKNSKYIFYENLTKKEYLRLVKFCDNFYTNSSSISEIKKLNKKAYHNIGKRNKNRTQMTLDENSPRKLFDYLKNEKTVDRNNAF